MSDSQLTTTQPRTVKEYLALPAYKDRFAEVLGKKAPQFLASVTALSNLPALRDTNPKSVIAAAMVSATLDLPVNPQLGMAHVVSYSGEAQFQMGWKGYVQLAHRSGEYRHINAGPVNAGVFTGYNQIGEPKMDWDKFDPDAEAVGYFCAFELLNGFTKIVYWPKSKAEAHAKRYSKAYAKGYSTPWKSDFDAMATKTVVKNALTKWGILSVEMQRATIHDQGVQSDVEAEVKYVDGDDKTVDEAMPGDPPPARPAPRTRSPKGAAAVAENPVPPQPVQVQPAEEPKTVEQAKPEPASEAAPTDPAPDAAPQPRAFLQDAETLEAVVKVLELKPGAMKSGDVTTPSVRAKVSGGYVGEVYHLNGAAEKAGAFEPLPPWKVGAELKVVLLGKKNSKGTVVAYVQSVEAVPEVF